MIIVKNIVKKFKMGTVESTVLKGINFTVPKGQFLAITGRSGSGKSTLLYQLGLLDHPSEGTITINDEVVTNLYGSRRIEFRRNNLGYIFQDYAVLPTLTAKENVMLPMMMGNQSRGIIEERAEIALKKVGLEMRINNLPSQLSGGEQQRVGIARAIAHNPSIIFADEPTANLDTESSKVVLDIFLKLNSEGQTIIMVTHEPEYAKLADRTIEIRDGKVIMDTSNKKNAS
jgi:putative ABC transport system ATP-binding protein